MPRAGGDVLDAAAAAVEFDPFVTLLISVAASSEVGGIVTVADANGGGRVVWWLELRVVVEVDVAVVLGVVVGVLPEQNELILGSE